MRLKDIILLSILNVVGFYGLKYYNDTRQTRLVSELMPSVVKVSPVGDQYIVLPISEDITLKMKVGFGVMGHGSGVFISKDGLIVTCAHVMEGTSLAEVSLSGYNGIQKKGAPKGYKTTGKLLAYVVGRDVKNDVALLKLCRPLKGIRPIKLASSVKRGLPVITIGFPGPMLKYVTFGIVSGFMGGSTYSDLVIAPGNSGGGVFDSNGKLVGLARFMTGPINLPIYQGFSGLTALQSIRDIVEKYQ